MTTFNYWEDENMVQVCAQKEEEIIQAAHSILFHNDFPELFHLIFLQPLYYLDFTNEKIKS